LKPPHLPQASNKAFWWLLRRGTGTHVRAYKLTRGRIGGKYLEGAPVALLETVGRKSGKLRTTPVVCGPDGDNLVLIASRGGVDAHPAWYFNLMADPETNVWWKGRKRRVRARRAEGAERERLWQMMVGLYSGYATYPDMTEREIPLLVLEPAG
jgi:deazaflavin-dependent oxidoreductase (nitroreductase family)